MTHDPRRSGVPISRASWSWAGALVLAVTANIAAGSALAQPRAPDPKDWPAVLAAARSETVYWNAWAGEPRINAYIAWVGEEVSRRFGVTLVEVKLADTSDAVAKVVAEKVAGRIEGGAVDLIWINGPNFASMQQNGLLLGGWAEELPNFRYVDPARNPLVRSDFTVPTRGAEAPWGMAQIVFYYDAARLKGPPRSIAALRDWACANRGRFTYPEPPDFLGATFLKQALIALTPDPSRLQRPVSDSDFAEVTAPLWAYLDALRPCLWRGGRAYPDNQAALRPLLADDEIDLAFAFDPSAASAAIASRELPETVRSYVLDGGTIGNANFVAIPFNAAHKAAAMVVADFLLSPEAQARKQDPKVWGGFTVLSMDRLSPADRARFAALDLGIATPSLAELGTPLPEPHPSWMTRIIEDWRKRYAAN